VRNEAPIDFAHRNRHVSESIANDGRGERAVSSVEDVPEPQIRDDDWADKPCGRYIECRRNVMRLPIGGRIDGYELAYLCRSKGTFIELTQHALITRDLERHAPLAELRQDGAEQGGSLARHR
jgi:hypothetical protein